MKTEDEFLYDLENGTDTRSKNEVADTPDNFKKWIIDNKDRIAKAEERGTLPYFIKENKNFVSISDKSFSLGSIKETAVQDAINSIKDISKITDNEIVDILMSFAKDNTDWFDGELKGVHFMKNSEGFMSMERQYRLGAGDRIFDKGNALYITDKNIDGFNPLAEFKGALNAIKEGKNLTFKQEYAVECVWHEFLHGKATGWSNINNKTDKLFNSMEVANQFCARRSYIPFLESLGGKSLHAEQIMAKGIGYRNELDNFNLMIDTLKIDKSKLYDFLSDKVINTKYEDIFDEMTRYISKETGIGKRKINELIENLNIADFRFEKRLSKTTK
ncbi:MAG: hypothetical protein LBE11_03275 [Prevotellaceae bacterium]|nr:hypothetical protein [Prevotellaceae bacterium]